MTDTVSTTDATVSAATPTNVTADVAAARRTLALEADALRALADTLDGAFTATVETLAAVPGRVIVSGIGKSGHVARKVAATLASTGTPAFFVHPAEASHGDLGMITEADAVLALSNSGETPELSDIVAYTRRFAIPLIAMTSKEGSTLAEAADHALVLPKTAEACPLGLAPTTSTTMMLALGDALAVALLERKGFTAADFHLFHPGGQLGKRLLKVSDLMHGPAELPLVALDSPMSEVLVEMSAKGFGSVGIVEDGRLVGIITDGDLRRHMAPDLLARNAGAVMTPNPRVVEPTMLAAEALHLMNTRQITGLFVVAEGRPVGLLHIHDLLRAGVA